MGQNFSSEYDFTSLGPQDLRKGEHGPSDLAVGPLAFFVLSLVLLLKVERGESKHQFDNITAISRAALQKKKPSQDMNQ